VGTRRCSAAMPSPICRPPGRRSPKRAVHRAKCVGPTTARYLTLPTRRVPRLRSTSRPGGRNRPELNGSGPGELSYVTYEVPHSAAFRDFYGRVLHWRFEPGSIEDGWQVTPVQPMAGVAGGSSRHITAPMWTVADIDAAVARVREVGGTVLQEPARQPYGLTAECTDNQGGRFHLGQF